MSDPLNPEPPQPEVLAPPAADLLPLVDEIADGKASPSDPLPLPAPIATRPDEDKLVGSAEQLLGSSASARSPAGHLAVFNPTTLEEARWIATQVSKSGLVPDALKGNPGAVLAVMARGAQLGVHWSVAVQTFYVVYGRVSIPADIFAAACDTDPRFEYFEVLEVDDAHATVEAKMKRWGEPRRYTVTIEEAILAGYCDGKHSALWGKADGNNRLTGVRRPRIMLAHMAQREAARLWNPARFAGLYTPDELGGEAQAALVQGTPRNSALKALGSGGAASVSLDDLVPVVDKAPTPAPTPSPEPVSAATRHEETPAAAPPVPTEVQAPLADHPAAKSPGEASVVRLAPASLAKIRDLLGGKPLISLDELQSRLGAPLDRLAGKPGQSAAELETEVLRLVRVLKGEATARK